MNYGSFERDFYYKDELGLSDCGEYFIEGSWEKFYVNFVTIFEMEINIGRESY